ncbi:unnamed protein product [Ascophyllum nodosum]
MNMEQNAASAIGKTLIGAIGNPGEEATDAVAPSTSTWDFDSYLAEQQRNHEDHEVRREQTFQRVLSALGGPVADPPTLPLDVLNAWDAHNGKVVTTELEAKKAKKQQMKNAQEDREISLQRERLRRRHMTGGEDSTGEDPLASRAEELSTSSPPCHGSLSTSEPVRLELGIDPDLLNTILAEVEEGSTVAREKRGTNSELSGVLDILDEAAGDTRAKDIMLHHCDGGNCVVKPPSPGLI